MKKSRSHKYVKIVLGLAMGMSLFFNTGCSIFVTRETKHYDSDAQGTTENVDVGTELEAPAGNTD